MLFQRFRYLLVLVLLAFASCKDRHEVARLHHTMTGCFFGEENELTIYEKNDTLMAELVSFGHKIYTAYLSKAQMDYFNSFVDSLRKFKKEGFCTNFENYFLEYNYERIRRGDGTCQWNGFSKLCKALFSPIAATTPSAGF